METLVVLAVGLVAGTLGGIVGTGSSLLLMPVLVLRHGPLEAVPVMAIAAFLGNLGRVLAWRREVDWRAAAAWCATAVPGAVLGVRTLLAVPTGVVESALGLFFLAMIPARRWLARRQLALTRTQLALLGGPLGFLTGVVVSTGPLTVLIFSAYGLGPGPLLGTEALSSLAVYATKVAAFQGFGALPPHVVAWGLATGASLLAGSFVGKQVVLRMAPGSYRLLIDALMGVSGLTLLGAALR